MRKSLLLLSLVLILGCGDSKTNQTDKESPGSDNAQGKNTDKLKLVAATKPLLQRAEEHIQNKQYDAALKSLAAAIKIDPNSVAAYSRRARLLADAGRHRRALLDFNKAVQLDPKNKQLRNMRGFFILTRAAYDKAIADFT